VPAGYSEARLPMSSELWTGVAGKRVVITGATSGIGLAAARRLAQLGAEVTIVVRSPERAQRAAASIPRPVDVLLADLASQREVRRLAESIRQRYPELHVLINNAGAMYSSRELTEDGVELTWAVNHLAPFLLTTLLLEKLKASAPARIITTASAAHYRAQIPFDDLLGERAYPLMGYVRYGQSKLANILFTRALAKRLAGTGVTANCFHPGFVGSGFNHNNGRLIGLIMSFGRLFARTPERGADTLVWLADSPSVSNTSGAYFMDRREVRPSQAARDDAAAERLWQLSQQQVATSAVAR
jgi:NAD(P)-dependent dehydrogenase (short-subunit alcohol dehydrogenase family)